MARSTDPDHKYIYCMGSETLPSDCYILLDESSIPFYSTSNPYNYYLAPVGKVKIIVYRKVQQKLYNFEIKSLIKYFHCGTGLWGNHK